MDKWKDDIENYRLGKLTSAERHALERKALIDPFLADALEGAEEITADSFAPDIEELNKKILGVKKNKWLWPLRIAATVAGIALIGTAIIYTSPNSTENLAGNQEKKDQVPAESKTDTVNQSLAQSGDTIKDEQNQVEESESGQNKNLVAGLKTEVKESKPAPDVNEQTSAKSLAGAGRASLSSGPVTTAQAIISDSVVTGDLASATQRTTSFTVTDADDLMEAVPATQPVPQARKLLEEGRMKQASGLASSGLVVRGVVRDQSGQPIPGVNIILKGSATGTVTNAEGRYSIEVEEKDQVLEYSFIGFVSQEQPIGNLNRATLDVKLEEDVTQLSEVVVTGYGVKPDNSEPVVRLAEPIGGRKAYDLYLEEKKVYPQQALENKVEGKVVIEFTVGISGALSDFQVIRKLGYGCEDEVIRLVREGPAWKPTYVDNEAIESLVRIRTRFSLPGK